MINDQLIRIQKDEIWSGYMRSKIVEYSRETFESAYFTQIHQQTLISLLSLDELKIAEIDVLAAVLAWLVCEVQRQGLSLSLANRRKVFEQIKDYIVFTALTPQEIASCKELADLLTAEERGSLLLHVTNRVNPLTVQPKTPRKAGDIQDSFVKKAYLVINQKEIEKAEKAAAKEAKKVAEKAAKKLKKAAKEREARYRLQRPRFNSIRNLNFKWMATLASKLKGPSKKISRILPLI